MLDREIFKKIRRIEIQSRKPVEQLFAGEYRSVFKGQGLEFHEVREYQPGDDIRSIDWNVSARLGRPFVKRYIEERQRIIVLMVDVSASQDFGSLAKSKNEVAAELAALLAFSAIKNNDQVGLLLFSDQVERYFPPQKGKKHVLRLIREILAFKRQGKKTDIGLAIKYLSRIQRKRAIVFLISDFLDQNYEQPLRALSRRHDLIPVWTRDRFEQHLPNISDVVYFEDPETGQLQPVDLSDGQVRQAYARAAQAKGEIIKRTFHSLQADFIEFATDGDYVKTLNLFFKRRQKRLRHS